MKKLIMTFIPMVLLIFLSSPTYSQECEILHVWMNDGKETALMLDTHPVVTFSNGKMVITSDEQTFEFPFNIVSRFTYSVGDFSSIEEIKMDLERNGEYVALPEGTTKKDVSVYTTDGRLMSVKIHESGQRTILNISSLPKGVYIVKAKNRTFKMTRP